MPFYDYRCSDCQEVFETFHGITETPEVQCPKCSGPAIKKIPSSVGIAFKGSGFYVTDSKGSAASGSSSSSGTTTATTTTANSSIDSPSQETVSTPSN